MRIEGLCTLKPSSGILHHYHLTSGSTLTSQDYNPSSVVYVPEPIRAIYLAVFSIDRNAIGRYDFVRMFNVYLAQIFGNHDPFPEKFALSKSKTSFKWSLYIPKD